MTCTVPLCPAEALPGRTMCRVHAQARLASTVALLALKKCATCKRKLKATDWIYRDAGDGLTRHVHCEPAKPRRRKKDEPKPLLDVAEGRP